jgi:hypothetical protein
VGAAAPSGRYQSGAKAPHSIVAGRTP